MAPSGLPVSVLVPVTGATDPVRALLDTLATQTIGADIEVVIASAAALPASLQTTLADLFPGRHAQIVDPQASRGGLVDLAATRARPGCLVICDPGVRLPNPRTLALLSAIAADPHVGSASCSLAVVRQGAVQASVCGHVVSGVSFLGLPSLTFERIDGRALVPGAALPVLAVSLALLAIRSEVLAAVGGCGAAEGLDAAADVALGLRLAEAGFTNIATTLVTALAPDLPPPRRAHPLVAGPGIAPATLDRLFATTTVVQRVV
ncbi:hypothetical protein [Methylobrevis pamukkalensis]|uniref:hypothetical protein n=1 Tax=Methylobrevis pamukkalensis TaxID=1439726 RepID=UPI001471EE0F|nr:hypothetical protein [Methylobrevis pamukkalensis]